MLIPTNLRQPIISGPSKTLSSRQAPAFKGSESTSSSSEFSEQALPPAKQLKMLDTQTEIRRETRDSYLEERKRHPELDTEPAPLSDDEYSSTATAPGLSRQELNEIKKSKAKSDSGKPKRQHTFVASEGEQDFTTKSLQWIQPSVKNMMHWVLQTQKAENHSDRPVTPKKDAQQFRSADDDTLSYIDDEHKSLPPEEKNKTPDLLKPANLMKHTLQAHHAR